VEELLFQLKTDGFCPESVVLDGRVRRFNRDGHKNAWYVGWEIFSTKTGKPFHICIYGDWKTGEKFKFQTPLSSGYSRDDQAEIRQKAKEAQKLAELERERAQEEAAEEALKTWNKAQLLGKSDYLDKKKIGLHHCRTILGSQGREILVPCRDIDGKLWGLQRILEDGKKLFFPNQKIQECFFTIGEIDKEVLICEGFATGASIHEATEKAVVVCFNAGNLESVCRALKQRYPELAFLICGDDDAFTESGNIGREKAQAAAKTVNSPAIFPKFSAGDGEPTDFNDLFVREGKEVVRSQILKEKPTSTFIRALGYDGEGYYYISSDIAQIKRFGPKDHTSLPLLSLLSSVDYWETMYPGKMGINWQQAAASLMSDCKASGPFSVPMVRGMGAWEDDGLILNLGNGLWKDGQRISYGALKSKYIYEVGHAIIPEPHPKPLEDTTLINEVTQAIRFKDKNSKIFFMGQLAILRLGGALRWRPHLWIVGPAGTGKTTLLNLLTRAAGPYGMRRGGGSTEAGIRQSVGSSSLTVLFDECEPKDRRNVFRIESLLELIRLSSSDNGGITKGGPGGISCHYTANSMFCLASVNPVLNGQADISRFTKLELVKNPDKDQWPLIEKMMDQMDEEYCDRLFSRMVHLYPVLKENCLLFEEAIRKKYTPRLAQQYGIILAGYTAIVGNSVLSIEAVSQMVELIKFPEEHRSLDESDEKDALNHLLQSKIRVNSMPMGGTDVLHNMEFTVAEVIRANNNPTLIQYGMKVKDGHIFVSKKNPNLKRIYDHTPWSAGWTDALRRIPKAMPENVWMGSGNERCTKIPIPDDLIMDPLLE
jgi:putative DNA primase/helicase